MKVLADGGVLQSVSRYWHTVRHLQARQIFGRVAYKVLVPRPDSRPGPTPRSEVALRTSCCVREQSLLAPRTLRLLGRTWQLPETGGWDDAALSKLWRYNLHYFDDLVATNCHERRDWQQALISRWVRENPPAVGTGWEPYPTSLRIVNWVKAALDNLPLDAAAVQSLAVQARWLRRRIEHHLQGNHLIANGKALYFAGCFLGGREGDEWRAVGRELLSREFAKQVLADGGHFELSPMYHAIVLEDLLDVLNLSLGCSVEAPREWLNSAGRMLSWLGVMTHPDGEIAFFNDAALGVAASPRVLRAYADRLEVPAPDRAQEARAGSIASGYHRLGIGDACVIADCAEIGPQHLPAHAHADTLSFELSLGVERILVNSGTSEYGVGAERQRQRGTAAHNTVVVDQRDSSEVWAGFRVARRAHPIQWTSVDDADGLQMCCAHDGYRRLPGGVVHRRCWRVRAGRLDIDDSLEGAFIQATAFFHFHPDVAVEQEAPTDLRLRTASGRCLQMRTRAPAEFGVADSTWHPAFGKSVLTKMAVLDFKGPRNAVSISW